MGSPLSRGFSVVTCSSFFFTFLPPPTRPRRRKMRTPPRPLTVTVSSRTTTSGPRNGPSCLCVSLGIPGWPALPLVHRFPDLVERGPGGHLCRDPRHFLPAGRFLVRHRDRGRRAGLWSPGSRLHPCRLHRLLMFAAWASYISLAPQFPPLLLFLK